MTTFPQVIIQNTFFLPECCFGLSNTFTWYDNSLLNSNVLNNIILKNSVLTGQLIKGSGYFAVNGILPSETILS